MSIFRKTGNDLYKKKQLTKALACYKQALSSCRLEALKSKELALCLGNMSAVLFELSDNRSCYTASILALASEGLPEKNRVKLEKRCEACLEREPSLEYTFKKIPTPCNVSDNCNAMEIQYNKKVGRHGKATKDIKFGDIIFVDNPIGMVPSYPLNQRDCVHCLNAIDTDCAIVSPFDPDYRFCSKQCLLDAFHTYHCFESRFNFKKIFLDRNGKYEKCMSRFLLNMRLILQKSLIRHDADESHIFNESDCDRQFGSESKIEDIRSDLALDNMETHMATTSNDKQMSYIIHCLLILSMLELVDFLDAGTDQALYNKIGYQLFHNQGAILMNSHYIYATQVSPSFKDRNDQCVHGSCLYPVLPLLNHSCKSNTFRFVTDYSCCLNFS